MLVASAAETDITPAGLTVGDWLAAGAVLVAGIVVGRVVQGLLIRVVHRGEADADEGAALALGRFVGFVFAAAGLVYSLSVLGVRLGPLVGALGIGGLAVAFAGQTILANFLGSIILQLRRPFRRGDQIATNGCEGTVIDVNFRTVVLRSFDGERQLVPCSQVLANPITNYTALGQRRTTLSVSVSYDTDLQRARDVLLEAVTGVEGVLDRPSAEVWVEEFADSGVTVAIRFWHAPDIATLWRVRSDVPVAAKRAVERSGIEIPFPQRVLRFADPAPAQRPGDDARQRSAGGGAPAEDLRRPSAG
jgi:small conductance mechanosensitive channel